MRKIEEFLKFRRGELTKLVELQRREELKWKLADPPTLCLRKFENWFFVSVNRTNKNKSGRFSKDSLSVSLNFWSPRNLWMWSRELPNKNWGVKVGSV